MPAKKGIPITDIKVNLSKIRSDLLFVMVLSIVIAFSISFAIGLENYLTNVILTLTVVLFQGILMFVFVFRRRRLYQKKQDIKINEISEKLTIHSSDTIGLDKSCSICRINFKPDQEVVICPNCKSYFHLEHLQKWLKENFSCPICKYDFEVLFFQEELNDLVITDE